MLPNAGEVNRFGMPTLATAPRRWARALTNALAAQHLISMKMLAGLALRFGRPRLDEDARQAVLFEDGRDVGDHSLDRRRHLDELDNLFDDLFDIGAKVHAVLFDEVEDHVGRVGVPVVGNVRPAARRAERRDARVRGEHDALVEREFGDRAAIRDLREASTGQQLIDARDVVPIGLVAQPEVKDDSVEQVDRGLDFGWNVHRLSFACGLAPRPCSIYKGVCRWGQ